MNYYQVKEETLYDSGCFGGTSWSAVEKDFAKLEDAEKHLAERLKLFENLAKKVAEYHGNYDHCTYDEDGVLISFIHSKDYKDYRPELTIKPLN